MEEIQQIWRNLRNDDEVRVVVLRAAPSKAFCAGLDVSKPWRPADAHCRPWSYEDPADFLGIKRNKVWKPLIVAVSGMAAGGAFYFLNEADIVICSEESTFFDPHVTYNQVSACEPIGSFAKMPFSEIQRMVLLGNHERITAQTALRISLVTEVVAADALWDRAHELAGFIALKHPVAIEGSVKAMWDALSMPFNVALENAIKYPQMGNPVSTAGRDRKSMNTAPFVLR
jgi:enoyl-CoA hydratase/carnithine racemase